MGAYLYFKTESNAKKVSNYLLEESKLNKLLMDLEEQHIYIYCNEDIEWARNERPDMIDEMIRICNTGNIKTSGGISETTEQKGYDYEDIAEIWTSIFEELNEKFKMKYYARSCSLSLTSSYFTIDQMKRITKNGTLLGGKNSSKDYVVKAYNELYNALKEEETKDDLIDTSSIKINDEVMIDGSWKKVILNNDVLKVQMGDLPWENENLEDMAHLIQEHRKYVDKIRYEGATCDVETFIKDGSTLIYLELSGQEYMVKSITSVLMQGRTRQNDHSVDATCLGFFDINKAGNKRKMSSLDDGIAHAILFHSPSIMDTNFSVLVGETQDEILKSFSVWMEKSQPLPFPRELTNKIYSKLESRDKIIVLNSKNIEAVKIDLSILEDEYHDLQEIILEVCKENKLIDSNAKPIKQQAPLPKSNYLTVGQVQKIYDTLNSMPKTYELEDVKIKPVGLKLFGPNFTYYIVEADKGCEEDEFQNEHTQCFGYVVNESDSNCSEWGYINTPEILGSTTAQGFGFEQDLHFDDMFIKQNGDLIHKDKLRNKFICSKCSSKQVEIHETIDETHYCSCTDCGHMFNKKQIKEVA